MGQKSLTSSNTLLPDYVKDWFASRQWQPHAYQLRMLDAFARGTSSLLIAPTGGGKTLSGFLPSLIDIHEAQNEGLHTLYISPLKALTNDIERNLLQPIEQMQLQVKVESRHGDTPSAKRQRQRKKPPHILLTTPESLMLMLSYTDAPKLFKHLRCVIIDEVHSFAHNKRGDFTALALARLQQLAPHHVRFGLSATVAEPEKLTRWLTHPDQPTQTIQAESSTKPEIDILEAEGRMPYGGFMARYAMPEIYSAITQAGTSIVFVNTRAQAELVFQLLWDHNTQNLPIAVYHGSLSKEQRRRTEAMMAAGKLRCVVATSALELGIDWGDVDLVIQLGAPKGVSRLLQRIGRSNHRFNEPSKALLVPSNRFEAMECRAAIEAIDAGKLDGEALLPGSYDVVVQFIINCACSAPVNADSLYREIITAPPYAPLPRAVFDQLFEFAIDGGYVLRRYERYQRLIQNDEGDYIPASRLISQRHRQNIGTIVEAAHLRVKRMNPKRGGKILGTIEEHFAQQLTPGDTFFFGGETLAFIRVHDMTLEARPAPAKEPKIPSYVGGQMPLSTFLADGVRRMFNREQSWHQLPHEVQEWLSLQKQFSTIPPVDGLLVESFPRHKLHQCLFYTFEGRKANQTLGMLITRRMERLGLKPLSFLVTDYGLAVTSVQAVDAEHISALLSPDLLGGELEEWIAESPMLKRSFRRIATVAGLIEQRYAGSHKTVKQVTFSTDLIYDVLRKHEPNHILLHLCRQDAERELLDIKRLSDMLNRFEDKVLFHSLTRPSPLSVPVISDVRNEAVPGSGIEALLELGTAQEQADQMMEDVRNAVA